MENLIQACENTNKVFVDEAATAIVSVDRKNKCAITPCVEYTKTRTVVSPVKQQKAR